MLRPYFCLSGKLVSLSAIPEEKRSRILRLPYCPYVSFQLISLADFDETWYERYATGEAIPAL